MSARARTAALLLVAGLALIGCRAAPDAGTDAVAPAAGPPAAAESPGDAPEAASSTDGAEVPGPRSGGSGAPTDGASPLTELESAVSALEDEVDQG